MASLRGILPELHAYIGLALLSVGVGFIFWPAGLAVGGLGLFALSYRVERPLPRMKPETEQRLRAVETGANWT